SFKITDSKGRSANFNVATRNPKTIGDVIDGINGLGINVEARINDTGDGIVLVDTGNGTGSLAVTEVGTGKAASQLRILGTAGSVQSGNTTVSGIDGSKTIKITTTSSTTVEELVTKINELSNGPVQANLINLGTSGVRQQLNGKFTGGQSRVAISSDLNFSFTQTSEARDALVSFGANEAGGGVLASSSSNTFTNLVKDLSITVNGTSTSPVTVTVDENADTLTTQVQTFVDQYNKLRDKYDELTAFDSTAGNVGLLFGSAVTIRVEQAYSRLLTAPIRSGANGAIRSLPELGVKMGDNGKLTFDKAQFTKALDANPSAVKDFFTNETNGFAKKAKDVSDSLAGVDNGALISRNKALQTTIESNNSRISSMDTILDKQRTRLLNQFYAMETTISKLQANMNSISSIQSLSSTTTRSSR
ncbi:MAG: flagellar filament capping protein FliD, partial [Pirellulales bacterium]